LNVFKTKGIVLKVKKQNEVQSLYTIFFHDYGILTVQKKKKSREKPLDIGYVVQCEIITKSSHDIHTIGNIKILSQFIYENREYKSIELYLRLIQYILKEIPKWVPQAEIFSLLKYISENSKVLWYTHLVLLYIKVQYILWNMWTHSLNLTVQKILRFIEKTKAPEICKLSGVNSDILAELEQASKTN